jgi:hypothetical protein
MCLCVCVCCVLVSVDNKLYKVHGTYIKTVSKLLEQTVINLFGPNYLINRSIEYLFWPGLRLEKIAQTLGSPWPEKIWELLN